MKHLKVFAFPLFALVAAFETRKSKAAYEPARHVFISSLLRDTPVTSVWLSITVGACG
jgi:hypothetical protein